jgi:hypothetical protein
MREMTPMKIKACTVGLALLLAGCSGASSTAKITPPSVVPSIAATAPAPSPTPTTLTLKEAADAYLAAVKPTNSIEEAFLTTMRKDQVVLADAKRDAARYAASLRTFSLFLAHTSWPASVAGSAAALRASVAEEISAVRTLADATSISDLTSSVGDFVTAAKGSGGKIDLMRQDLGLPPAS